MLKHINITVVWIAYHVLAAMVWEKQSSWGEMNFFMTVLWKKKNINNKNKQTKKSSKNNRQDTGHADSSLGLKLKYPSSGNVQFRNNYLNITLSMLTN